MNCATLIACFILFELAVYGQQKPVAFLDALARSNVVMYVSAHPDDEDSIGGVLARITGAGKKLVMVCFTQGENEPGDVGVPKGRAMAAARRQWFLDSTTLLGAEPIHLSYTDGPVSVAELEHGVNAFWPRNATTEDVLAQWRKIDRDPYEDMVRCVRKYKPDLLLTWETTQGWTGNAEHRTTGMLAQRAFAEAANPAVFPELSREDLDPWRPKYLFFVLRGDGGDVVGPNPMETIGCDNAPGPRGKSACEVRAEVLMSYKRHTVRTATAQQLAEMQRMAVEWVKHHPEHLQLGQEEKK